jgi:DNA-binding GntR family transcriptional regulator
MNRMKHPGQTVGATTYQRIKHDIVFGLLPPGSKVKLDDLKRRYEASLPTLREALNRLASEGFVDAQEQRGFFVTPVSGADLAEIAELRILLECHALRLSIANGDTEWEGRLVAAHHKLHLMEQRLLAGDESGKETWKRYDWEFHQAMISNCQSANLLALHRTLFEKYLRYQMLVLTHRGELAAEEHRAMLDRALARDADGASEILKTHINGGLEHTVNAMQ